MRWSILAAFGLLSLADELGGSVDDGGEEENTMLCEYAATNRVYILDRDLQ
jgi:hypothetical protein